MAAEKRAELLATIQKASKENGSLLADPRLNEHANLMFKLRSANKKDVPVTLFFPDNDKGEFGALYADEFLDLGRGDALHVLQGLVNDFAKRNSVPPCPVLVRSVGSQTTEKLKKAATHSARDSKDKQRRKSTSGRAGIHDELPELKCLLIKEMKFENDALIFQIPNGKDKQTFCLTVAKFPDACILTSHGSTEAKTYSGKLGKIFQDIEKDIATRLKIRLDKLTPTTVSLIVEVPRGPTVAEHLEDLRTHSTTEHAALEAEAEQRWKESADFLRDVENVRALYGWDRAVDVRPVGLLEEMHAELNIALDDVLDAGTCEAWGVDGSVPITISIGFPFGYLESVIPPRHVEVYQLHSMSGVLKNKAFRLRPQLAAIVTAYVNRAWPLYAATPVSKRAPVKIAKREEKPKPAAQPAAPEKKEKSKGGFFSSVFSSKPDKKHSPPSLPSGMVRSGSTATNLSGTTGSPSSLPKGVKASSSSSSLAADVAQLVEMGYSNEMAVNALNTAGSFDEAAALLLAGDDAARRGPMSSVAAEAFAHKKLLGDYGFLAAVYSYVKSRLANLNVYCVICDQPHVFGNMLKPGVCSRELCCWSFQQLGVGTRSADDIATAAEVADLLVCFATAAASSQRNQLIFEPYPTIMDPNNSKVTLLSPNNKEFNKLNDVLRKMPSVEKISAAKDHSDMKASLDRAHPLAFELLQWIISSNRSHIVKLPPAKHVRSMITPHQYLLMSAPPEREAKFRELKKKHGSVFAFHGSSLENWHCVLRLGLRNATGTKLQVNGAAYGNGIYLSPHAGTSFTYSKMSSNNQGTPTVATGGNRFLQSKDVFCVAMCEVIDTADIRKKELIWVCPHEEHVLTRFFFVYLGPEAGKAADCSTEKKPFMQEVENAMQVWS